MIIFENLLQWDQKILFNQRSQISNTIFGNSNYLQQTIKFDKHDRMNAVNIIYIRKLSLLSGTICNPQKIPAYYIFLWEVRTVPCGTREDRYKNSIIIIFFTSSLWLASCLFLCWSSFTNKIFLIHVTLPLFYKLT